MQTKFEIGQEVFFLNDYGITKGYVYRIIMERNKETYELNTGSIKRDSHYLFASKEELLKYLAK